MFKTLDRVKLLEERIVTLEARLRVLESRTSIPSANEMGSLWRSAYAPYIRQDIPLNEAVEALARHLGVELHYRPSQPPGSEVKPVAKKKP